MGLALCLGTLTESKYICECVAARDCSECRLCVLVGQAEMVPCWCRDGWVMGGASIYSRCYFGVCVRAGSGRGGDAFSILGLPWASLMDNFLLKEV